jgi:hypothetical protein
MISFIHEYSLNQHIGAIIFIIVFLILEIFLRRYKHKKKNEYEKKKPSLESLEDIEEVSLEYYKDLQHLDVVRFASIVLGIISVLAMYNVQAFNILAVATGAFILALRESFASLVAYFYILANYKLGDDLRVGVALGEVVRVKPLYIELAGKDENGEYNSKLFHVPNFMFFNQLVEQVKLKSDDYRKVNIQALYSQDTFHMSFADFTSQIESYLDRLLPKRQMTKVGYFRGYAGVRYKLNFDYNDKGEIVVKISFIARSQKAVEFKESIICFIEELKHVSLTDINRSTSS